MNNKSSTSNSRLVNAKPANEILHLQSKSQTHLAKKKKSSISSKHTKTRKIIDCKRYNQEKTQSSTNWNQSIKQLRKWLVSTCDNN